MKKIYIIITMMIFVSCSKEFLEVEVSNGVDEGVIFDDIKNAEINMIGMYDALISSYGAEGYRWILGPDVMGEDVFVTKTNNYGRFSSGLYIYVITPESNRSSALWTRSYRVIKSCNDLINKIDGAKGSDVVKKDLKAEALTMRAFTFLKLIRLYGEYAYSKDKTSKGIVLDLKSNLEEEVGRSSVEEAYKQIVKDLNEAIGLFSKGKNPKEKKWRMDKITAYSILANAHLDMENWVDAGSNASLARGGIDDGSDLMTEPEYTSGFNETNKETIWEHAFVVGQTANFLSLASFAYTTDDGTQGKVFGYNSLRVTKTFTNLFTATDYRKKLFPTKVATEGVYFTKYRHKDKLMGLGNIPRIRISEMYLIEAEAEAEAGGSTSRAQDLLFALQSRRDPSVTTKSSNTGQQLIDEILLERRKELFAEGHRLNDLKRRDLNLERKAPEHWSLKNEVIRAGDHRFNLPIPLSEINANKAITPQDQNRGYK